MKQVILGTAGHIDHGKTSLIRAMTGIDTDRLKEEKARGITIELGFAWLDLPSGQRLGIVDVPGHEKFVKNMVAGATGIDIVALIIAADEGVMPQTREHLDICRLLGVKDGLVVLTKIDMVDEDLLELAKEDVQSFLAGTFLDGAPMVPVSSVTGEGLPELVKAIDDLCARVPERTSSGLFRLPVDRVFTMKGFGTVITGSLVSGKIRVGESIMIYPSGIQSKVRGIQVHNNSVEEATAGMRTAINFQGLDRAVVNRGDVLGRVNTLKPSYMVDVVLEYLGLGKKPLKNRTRVRFHTGTSEILGHAVLLDREEIVPGESAIIQFRLEEPVSVVKDDRFVIRSYSPVRTIGGGRIINPIPGKHKRHREGLVQDLKGLADGSPAEVILYHIREAGLLGRAYDDLMVVANISEKTLEDHLQRLLSDRSIVLVDRENRVFFHGSVFEGLKARAIEILQFYHDVHPLKAGMTKETLKAQISEALSPRAFNTLFQEMVKAAAIVQEEENIRLPDHKIALRADEEQVRRKIERAYLDCGLEPPYFKDLAGVVEGNPAQVRDVLDHMVTEGRLVKVKEDLYFHRDAMDALKKKLVKFLKANSEITTPQLKELTGVSRKYTIPLIEYFDMTKVTIRVGDARRLREG